jgi:chitinase
MPQYYNSWAAVETPSIIVDNYKGLIQGYMYHPSPTSPGSGVLKIPRSKLIIGVPVMPGGASSGPTTQQTLEIIQTLKNQNIFNDFAGIMSWDIGWDQINGGTFGQTISKALNPSPNN